MAMDADFQSMSEQEMRLWALANPEHLNEEDRHGCVLIEVAMWHRHIEASFIAWLLENGCDVHFEDFLGKTLLFHANSAPVVSVLLEGGINPVLTDVWGRTALMDVAGGLVRSVWSVCSKILGSLLALIRKQVFLTCIGRT